MDSIFLCHLKRFFQGILYYGILVLALLCPVVWASLFGEVVGAKEYGDLYLEFFWHHLWIFAVSSLMMGGLNVILGDRFTAKLRTVSRFMAVLFFSVTLLGGVATDSLIEDSAEAVGDEQSDADA